MSVIEGGQELGPRPSPNAFGRGTDGQEAATCKIGRLDRCAGKIMGFSESTKLCAFILVMYCVDEFKGTKIGLDITEGKEILLVITFFCD